MTDAELELAFYEKFLFSKGLEPYPVQEQAIAPHLRRQERARHRADRHRQDADGEGRAVSRVRPRRARDLHDAAARAHRGEVPRAVRGLRRGQRRVRDRRLQGQSRGADPGRGRRDPVEPDRRREARVARRDRRHGRGPLLQRSRARLRLGAVDHRARSAHAARRSCRRPSGIPSSSASGSSSRGACRCCSSIRASARCRSFTSSARR